MFETCNILNVTLAFFPLYVNLLAVFSNPCKVFPEIKIGII